MSHSKSWSWSLISWSELESRFFSAGVGVWNTNFSNPGVGVPQKYKDSASLLISIIFWSAQDLWHVMFMTGRATCRNCKQIAVILYPPVDEKND